MSTINEAAILRFYVDTQEYSDRLTAIESQAASSIATHKTEVAAAIAQVNLTQSQTITALSLEVSNLKADLTNSITATQTDLINRADELAQDVTDITQQLTQEIQDALDSLQDEASLASALRTPRKIHGVDFDGTQDISLPTFSTQIDGLVPKRVGATTTKYLREDGTWVVPPDTTYALLTAATAEAGTATSANSISAKVLKEAIKFHAPPVTNIAGNAGTATKLQTPRTINGVSFDGTQDISLPEAVAYSLPTASASVLGGIKVGSGLAISNSVLSVGTLNQSTTGNAATSTKLQTARTINGVSFDGTSNITIAAETPPIATITSDATLASATTPGLYSVAGYSIAGLYAYGLLRVWSYGGVWNQMFISHNSNSNGSVAIRQSWNGTAGYNPWRVIDSPNVGGNAATTTKLQTARTIAISGAVTGTATSFDGSANITIATTGIDGSQISTGTIPAARIPTLNQSTTGNADSATKLATGRTINGIAFDGTANITIPLETPTATEAIAGKAKIATTAIAQAGVNDTDFITAKKLANTRQSVWVNKTGMLFGTTYANTALYEKEISFISEPISVALLATKVTFKNLTTVTETIVYFAAVVNRSSGFASANFIVPSNTSFKIEIVRTDDLSTVSPLAVSQWSERYYV